MQDTAKTGALHSENEDLLNSPSQNFDTFARCFVIGVELPYLDYYETVTAYASRYLRYRNGKNIAACPCECGEEFSSNIANFYNHIPMMTLNDLGLRLAFIACGYCGQLLSNPTTFGRHMKPHPTATDYIAWKDNVGKMKMRTIPRRDSESCFCSEKKQMLPRDNSQFANDARLFVKRMNLAQQPIGMAALTSTTNSRRRRCSISSLSLMITPRRNCAKASYFAQIQSGLHFRLPLFHHLT